MINSFLKKRLTSLNPQGAFFPLCKQQLHTIRQPTQNLTPHTNLRIRTKKSPKQPSQNTKKTTLSFTPTHKSQNPNSKTPNILNPISHSKSSSTKRSSNNCINHKGSEKIAKENLQLLKSLINKLPIFKLRYQEKDWKKTEKIIQNLSEYNNAKKNIIKNTETKIPTEGKFYYHKSFYINEICFQVFISKSSNTLKLLLQPHNSESFSLILQQEQALKIMGGKEDYDYLISLIRVQNGEIILLNPNEN